MLFNILFSLKWFSGFTGCTVIQMYLEKYTSLNRSKVWTITCILFQIYFVSYAGINIYNEWYQLKSHEELQLATLNNMYIIYGYFIYDIIYMLEEYPDKVFLTHHLVSLIIINTIKQMGITETWYHNILCFILEVTNPFINLRQLPLIKNSPLLKILNKRMIFITYLVCRIILLPITFISFFIKTISDNNFPITICISFASIYIVSVMWFQKIILMQNFNGNEFLKNY
jgi:hypothetical protein